MGTSPKSKESSHHSRLQRTSKQQDSSFFEGIQAKYDPFSAPEAEGGFFFQPKLTIHPAYDAYEAEADQAADQIINQSSNVEASAASTPLANDISRIPATSGAASTQRMPAFLSASEMDQNSANQGTVQTKLSTGLKDTTLQRQEEEEGIQSKTAHDLDAPSPSESFENQLSTSQGGGSSLPMATRQRMESGFGADFSGVRIHTGANAIQMNRSIGAQAFTYGNNIYFNQGNYNPGTRYGDQLLAHELTHTVQQGSSIQRKPIALTPAPLMVQGFGVLDLIPDWIINNARQIPGYTLFTVIIEYDPLRGESVERTPINLLEGLMGLVPFGTSIFDKLQEYGIIQKVFDWVSSQLNVLGLSTQGLMALVEEAWAELEFPYTDAIEVISGKLQTLFSRIESFAISLVTQIMDWVKEALIDVAEPYLAENQAWNLIKKIIRYDPLRSEAVEASTVEILEDFLLLIGKETELEQMRERGTLQKTADWLDTQIGTFLSLLDELGGLISALWDAIQPENLSTIVDSLVALAGQVTGFLQRVWDFASSVAIQVLELIKEALLEWLNSFAADIPGFTLLTVILGRNPLTGAEVPRSVENIIRGFMGLIPGGEAKFQELQQSGVIPRAVGQIEALVAELGISWAFILGLFTDIWNNLVIEDVINPIATFERIANKFGEPILRLFSFVAQVIRILLELILEIMGIPPDMIRNIIANAMSAIEDIKNDPIGFLLNLMNAVKEGFLQFLGNIGTHLLNGLQNWLFGTLSAAGIQMPPDLSLQSVLGLAMDVLGITVDNILDRLALRIGEERVAQIRSVLNTLSGIWAFVRDVIERGPIAIWEYIQSQISNLWNIIQEGIMGFIQERVIQQAITWLLSFLDVTGIMPIIRGVQSVFNAITSFIEKLREILGIVNSFVAGIADIACGNIQAAANFLETALADGIPVAIAFLAKQLGLGDISEKIQEMIEAAREKINEGIDWLIDQALRAGTAFLGALGLGGNNTPEDESSSIDPVLLTQINEALNSIPSRERRKLENGKLSRQSALEVAEEVKRDFPMFQVFEVIDGGESWDYHYVVNPDDTYDENNGDRPQKADTALILNVGDILRDKANENYFRIANVNLNEERASLTPLNSEAYAITLNISTIHEDIEAGNWEKLIPGGSSPVRVGDIIKVPHRTNRARYLATVVQPQAPGLVSYTLRRLNLTYGRYFRTFVEMISRQEIIILTINRDYLRSLSPSPDITSWAVSQLSPSDPDPAFPSLNVDGTPHADHIVPFSEIINMAGFNLLTPEQQLAIVNHRENFVALSPRANRSKGSKTFAQWGRHETLGIEVDRHFRRRMITKENQLRNIIQAAIDAYIEENTA